MNLKVGDRIEIDPPTEMNEYSYEVNAALALSLRGLRATVVKEPWFLAMHDVYRVGLCLDDGGHAEIEVDWCRELHAVDRLAERLCPPPKPKPWPKPKNTRPWWRRLLDAGFRTTR